VLLLALSELLLRPLALGYVPEDGKVLPGQELGPGPEIRDAERPVRAAQHELAVHVATLDEPFPRFLRRVPLSFGDKVLEAGADKLLLGHPEQFARRRVGVHVHAVVGGHQDGVEGAVEQGAQTTLALAKALTLLHEGIRAGRRSVSPSLFSVSRSSTPCHRSLPGTAARRRDYSPFVARLFRGQTERDLQQFKAVRSVGARTGVRTTSLASVRELADGISVRGGCSSASSPPGFRPSAAGGYRPTDPWPVSVGNGGCLHLSTHLSAGALEKGSVMVHPWT
jgi:hypothetical protein